MGSPEEKFYVELKPTSKEFLPDALKASGFDLDRLEQEGELPTAAMTAFKRWIETAAAGHKPVFVGFNACFDWQYVNWYLESFAEGNPFGFAGIDIKSYFMGFSGCP